MFSYKFSVAYILYIWWGLMQLFVYEAMKSRPVCEHSAYYLSEIYRMKTGLTWKNVYVKTVLQTGNFRGNLCVHALNTPKKPTGNNSFQK